jgi:hypothetical protein
MHGFAPYTISALKSSHFSLSYDSRRRDPVAQKGKGNAVRGVAGYKQATSNLVEQEFICSARANLAGTV